MEREKCFKLTCSGQLSDGAQFLQYVWTFPHLVQFNDLDADVQLTKHVLRHATVRTRRRREDHDAVLTHQTSDELARFQRAAANTHLHRTRALFNKFSLGDC